MRKQYRMKKKVGRVGGDMELEESLRLKKAVARVKRLEKRLARFGKLVDQQHQSLSNEISDAIWELQAFQDWV